MARLLDFARHRPQLTPRAAYDLWAGTYPPAAHNPLMRTEEDVVKSLLAQMTATRALDVGTGSGRYLPLLAATGASTILGVDFSLAMLRRGSGRLVCGDACRLPFRRGTFNLINASLMVGDVADLAGWAREMARALAVGGHLIYSDFHPSWVQHGWRRTFRDVQGQEREVLLVPHAIDEHLDVLEAAGLRVIAIREPRLKENGDPGVGAFKRRWGNPPVVAVFHAIRELSSRASGT